MTVNDYAREVHENAVAHGWWEGGERSFPEIAALIHSDIPRYPRLSRSIARESR